MEYKEMMLNEGRKTATINLMITAGNRYLNFAGHRECAVRALKVQTRQCPDNILSIDEYRRMTDYARKIGQDKYYCIMRTLALNGIRVSELSGCTVEAGVPWTKAHLHSFRHLSAITYMQKYANLPELADILGHSSLETTRIYTTTTAKDKRRRMNELDL